MKKKNPKRVAAGKAAAADHLKIEQVKAVLSDQCCQWPLCPDEKGQFVYCDKPAPFKAAWGFSCSYHAALKTQKAQKAESERDVEKFLDCKTRAEIVAVRDGGTA